MTTILETIEELLDLQSGVIARRQLLARGKTPPDIARMLRRREYALVHEGVYVNHTGELTWLQRAWAAVLFSSPAALTHRSALRAADGPGRRDADEAVIHVAVEKHRRLTAPAGVRLHRISDYVDRVQANLSPPRLRYDEAVLLVAASADDDYAALRVLADAVRGRRTTAQRLLARANDRKRLPRRSWITAVLGDIAAGTQSVLEHGYLDKVERAHSLSGARRQLPELVDGTRVYRDVEYAGGLIVELDGRLWHDNPRARDEDLDRDLDAATTGRRSVRLGWGQVFDRPCRTAERIGRLLGQPATPCGPACPARSKAA